MPPTLKQFHQQIRDFRLTLLVTVTAALLHLNCWHVVAVLNTTALPQPPVNISIASLAFTVGVCLSLMQHRPSWIKPRISCLTWAFMLLEMFAVLLLVDLLQLEIECTTRNMLRSKYLCYAYELIPNLLKHYLHSVYHFVQCVHAFWLLLASLESAAGHWQAAIEFLVFGKLPLFRLDVPY